jgi:hypothetical protein
MQGLFCPQAAPWIRCQCLPSARAWRRRGAELPRRQARTSRQMRSRRNRWRMQRSASLRARPKPAEAHACMCPRRVHVVEAYVEAFVIFYPALQGILYLFLAGKIRLRQ